MKNDNYKENYTNLKDILKDLDDITFEELLNKIKKEKKKRKKIKYETNIK